MSSFGGGGAASAEEQRRRRRRRSSFGGGGAALEQQQGVLQETVLRSFMELCILIPGSSSKNHRISGTKAGAAFSPASWKCSEEYFSQQIKSRDPLKTGFPTVWALRLVRQLLVWDPDERLSVDEALQHPYFQPQPKG